MTISEKIQLYRKNAGLSQEELAKNLLVSRQTISLWENGQTLPTIDNLIRLKEIFGISLDEMLCSDSTVKTTVNNECFDEIYTAISDEGQLSDIKRRELFPKYIFLALLSLLFLTLTVYTLIKNTDGTAYNLIFVIGTVMISAITLLSVNIHKAEKEFKELIKMGTERESFVKLNSESVILSSEMNGKNVSFTRISHTDAHITKSDTGFVRITSGRHTVYIDAKNVEKNSLINPLTKPQRNVRRIFFSTVAATLLIIALAIADLSFNNPLGKIEMKMGIKIPDYIGITEKENTGLVGNCHVEYSAEIFLDEKGASELEKAIITEEGWEESKGGSALPEIIPDVAMCGGAEFFKYAEYKNGRHILLLYFADENILKVITYTANN